MGRFNAGRQGRGGRGNGQQSRGGRGEGKSCSNNNNNNKSSSTKKTENINDFVFQPLQLGKQQASNTYESVKEFARGEAYPANIFLMDKILPNV